MTADTMTITRTGGGLGARVEGIDLRQPLSDRAFGRLMQAVGEHGVLHYPGQNLTSTQLKNFSERFGQIQGSISEMGRDPDEELVDVLSNIVEDGRPIGFPDAGQDWHTDMSYRDSRGFMNILHAIEVPMRDGKPRGSTQFSNMHRAYDELPAELKEQLKDAIARHDFNKYWDKARKVPGSTRPALTPEQRALRPTVTHPVFLTHPITGRQVLYANPGYTVQILGMSEKESDEILEFLFEHQLQDRFRHEHVWTVGDVLMWDHLGTIHKAIADYTRDERRHMKRCQVMANKVFDPAFVAAALKLAA